MEFVETLLHIERRDTAPLYCFIKKKNMAFFFRQDPTLDESSVREPKDDNLFLKLFIKR